MRSNPWHRRLPPTFWITSAFLSFLVVAVIVGPWLLAYSSSDMVGETWAPMSWAHPLGTDQLGRDMLARMLDGGRTSLALAGLIAVLAFALGAAAGLSAAFVGGWFDSALSRGADLLMSFPPLIFALLVIAILGNSIPVLIAVLIVFEGVRVFRVARALAVDISAQEFVQVARLRGEGMTWIVLREILPNALAPLGAEFAIRFVFGLLFISALSFLGLGVPPPAPDWGGMARENSGAISFGLVVPLIPAAMIAIVSVAVNLLADSLLQARGASRRDQA